MVGLTDAGEVAWFAESLFNYVLDTEKPLTNSILNFSRDAIDEFEKQVEEKYQNQHLIDIAAWGQKTEKVSLDEDVEEVEIGKDVVPAEELVEETPVEIEETDVEESLSVDADDVVDPSGDDELVEVTLESDDQVSFDEDDQDVIEMVSESLFDINAEEESLESNDDLVEIDDLDVVELLPDSEGDMLMINAVDEIDVNDLSEEIAVSYTHLTLPTKA